MRRQNAWFLIAAVATMFVIGCGNQSNNSDKTSSTPEIATKQGALKLDSEGNPETCTYSAGENCYKQGPGQKICCDPDGKVRYYQSDDNCTYPGLEGGPVSCEYSPCATDDDCVGANPDPDNLNASCVYTEATFADESAMPGLCFFAWEPCSTGDGTPCANSGFVVCEDGECACTALPDSGAASPETCNNVDDDCDGDTDEGFMIGQPCDGDDSDECALGTYTCSADGLDNECVNEPFAVLETCNGSDDDCDGAIDEDYAGLGESCDGDDADLCATGQKTCSADGNSVVCGETGEGFTETCNGSDDDCDGTVDEDVQQKFYADADGDMCPVAEDGEFTDVVLACEAPEGYINGDQVDCGSDGDCDDGDPTVYDGAPELCDGLDNDCDGTADEGFGLGEACDDADADLCALGTVVCNADGSGTVCSEVGLNQTESCNGQDDDCNGLTDEGCDDDGDGSCDNTMLFGAGAICGEPGDCDDTDPTVYDGAPELCDGLDNDCDGIVDGAAPACSSCANAIAVPCGVEYPLDMATELNTGNAIETYVCASAFPGKTKTVPGTLSAPEIVIDPVTDSGMPFSCQITTPGTGAIIARLHESCEPDEGTSSVSATPDGTCAGYSTVSVGGGVKGMDWVVIDAESSQQVTVKCTCTPPAE